MEGRSGVILTADSNAQAGYKLNPGSERVAITKYSLVARLDRAVNDNNHLHAVFFRQIVHQESMSQGFPSAIGPQNTDSAVERNTLGGSFDYTSILPCGYVLDARFGVIWHSFSTGRFTSSPA